MLLFCSFCSSACDLKKGIIPPFLPLPFVRLFLLSDVYPKTCQQNLRPYPLSLLTTLNLHKQHLSVMQYHTNSPGKDWEGGKKDNNQPTHGPTPLFLWTSLQFFFFLSSRLVWTSFGGVLLCSSVLLFLMLSSHFFLYHTSCATNASPANRHPAKILIRLTPTVTN